MKSAFGVNPKPQASTQIENPFGDMYGSAKGPSNNIILRTKKGERSVELELPGTNRDLTEFTIPLSPTFRDQETPVARGGMDERYADRAPSSMDRDILRTLPQGKPEDDALRTEIESGLGLVPSTEEVPQGNKSYLATMDHVKQLFKNQRYEAALLELDQMVRLYPTNPKLFQMKGTILDRLGYGDLAIKSWSQALEFDPGNEALRKHVDRKRQSRRIASP